ncbi:MAG: hypothetical protein RBT66_04845 [bacterium]|jgi:hypothetical protein|nr:hypothetical protein [bacterium]
MFTQDKEIRAEDVKRLLAGVYRRYHAGNITDSQAHKETYILNSLIKAIETTDLEQRLGEIESLLKRG